MRLRNKQVTNRGVPGLRIRPVAGASIIPRKERHQPMEASDECRPVGICVGHKITKIGNSLPECANSGAVSRTILMASSLRRLFSSARSFAQCLTTPTTYRTSPMLKIVIISANKQRRLQSMLILVRSASRETRHPGLMGVPPRPRITNYSKSDPLMSASGQKRTYAHS